MSDETKKRDYAWWNDIGKLAKLEFAFRMNCTMLEACSVAQIKYDQLYYYMNRVNLDYKENIEMWKQEMTVKARSTIVEVLLGKKTKFFKRDDKGNPKEIEVETDKDYERRVEMAKWYAERKLPNEFSTRVQLTGADNKPLFNPVTTKQDLLKMIEAFEVITNKVKNEKEV